MFEGSLTEYGLPWSEILAQRTPGFGRLATLTICLTLHPAAAARELTRLINLEPLGLARVELVARGARAFRHVGHDRAGVMRPLMELHVSHEGRSGFSRSDSREYQRCRIAS